MPNVGFTAGNASVGALRRAGPGWLAVELASVAAVLAVEPAPGEGKVGVLARCADDDPDALPQRLDLQSRNGSQQIDLRLRLETWRSEP